MQSGHPWKRSRKILLSVLLLLVLAGGGGWILLRHGITLNSFSTTSIDASGLSLRLDRGLILQVDRLTIYPAPKDERTGNFAQKIGKVIHWTSLFRSVAIHTLTYRGHSAALSYGEGNIRITGGDFSLAGRIASETGSYTFSGEFHNDWSSGTLAAKIEGDAADVHVGTAPFGEIGPLLQQLHLDAEARAWVKENISAGQYRIEDLHLQGRPAELFNPDAATISGKATARNAAIRFHPDLPPVTCDSILITYKDDRLSFALVNPSYRGRNLAGSSIAFVPLLRPGKTTMGIHIRTQGIVDRDILEILQKYDVTLPFRQDGGTTQAELTLTFTLPEFDLTSSGSFQTQGQWHWKEHLFQVHNTSLRLDNSTVQVEQGQISYGETLKTGISGSVDLDAKQAALTLDIEKLFFRTKGMTFLEAVDKTLPLTVDYASADVSFEFDELKTVMTRNPQYLKIDIYSIPALAPFMPYLRDHPVIEGRLQALVRDREHIRFDGELDMPNHLLSLEGKPVSRFHFRGRRSGDRTDIAINNNRITAVLTDTLAVKLQEYLFTVDAKTRQGAERLSSPLPMEIRGPAALIKAGELHIPTESFNLQTSGDALTFTAKMAQGDLSFTSSNGKQQFTGRDLDAALAADLFPNMDMSEGAFDVVLNGTRTDFKGYLELRNIHVKNTKILHNLLAFINTVPALATFTSPGFDSEGYLIRDGVVYFTYRDPVLTIRRMRTDGTTVNVNMQGWINLQDRTVNLDAELVTLKDYSKILSKIPLAGYAILDDDGSLSTSLRITGDLDAPDIRTNLARDILFTPLNVIKRTMQWPFRFLGKTVNGKNPLLDP